MYTLLTAYVSSDGEVAGIVIACLFGLAIILGIKYLIACEFMKAAQDKGYNDKKYLWITFLLGIIGMLLVIALPNKKQQANIKEDTINEELPNL